MPLPSLGTIVCFGSTLVGWMCAVPSLAQAPGDLRGPVRPLLELLPPVFQYSLLGLRLGQILGILFLLLGVWAAARILRPLLRRVLTRLAATRPSWPATEVGAIGRPVAWLLGLAAVRRILPELQLPSLLNGGLNRALDLAAAGLALWLAYRVIDAFCARFRFAAGQAEHRLDEQIMPVVRSILRATAIVVAGLLLIQSWGHEVTTLVAGLGLGGLAVALAAQETLANLLGSLTIAGDRPFRVGDAVAVEGQDGVVEHIGLRSTRIRTFHDSVVNIPNSKMVNSVLDNRGARRVRRSKHLLALRYDTDPERIEAFVEGIRELIRANPGIRQDDFEVHLHGLNDSSVDVLVYCYFDVSDWRAELTARHDLLLAILRFAREIGVDFAFPTRTLHLADGSAAASAGGSPAVRSV